MGYRDDQDRPTDRCCVFMLNQAFVSTQNSERIHDL